MTLTYGELARRVDEAARDLEPGSCVPLTARNTLSYVVAVHAILRAGAVLVPLDPSLPPADLRGLEQRARSFAPGFGAAAILFTSGTTGTPKAAVLTRANLEASAAASAARLGTGAGDTWLACLPMHHVGGLSILLRAARDGSAVEVHERFDAARVAEALASGRVTSASLVARSLERTLDAARGRFSSALRVVLVGGGPSPAALLARARAAGLPVARTYGLTEAASQVATQAPGGEDDSCGSPLAGTEVRIDAEAEGAEGEVLVRGPTVMAGYTGEAPLPPGGWLRTGDLGRLDAGGRLVVLDRRTDLIVTGGENVSPARVEAALAAHPAVDEACVAGVPDPSWGARVGAMIRRRAPVDPADLDRHCRARLAPHEVPRIVVFTEAALPRTAAGKLDRRRVREVLAEAPAHRSMGPGGSASSREMQPEA